MFLCIYLILYKNHTFALGQLQRVIFLMIGVGPLTNALKNGDYRGPFFATIPGALSKNLLIREEDVQVLHGFDSIEHAKEYLESEMFVQDVFVGLKPLWSAGPEVRIHTVA